MFVFVGQELLQPIFGDAASLRHHSGLSDHLLIHLNPVEELISQVS